MESAAAAAATSAASCAVCGATESLSRCSVCKSVSYCSRDHQRRHWKAHRGSCARPTATAPTFAVVVEIEPGEGGGMTNAMTNHVFDSRKLAERFVRSELRGSEPFEMSELPFLTDLMGFQTATLFLDRAVNQVMPPSVPFPRSHGRGQINAMAVYMGCRLESGLSPLVNASGNAFFIGTNPQGRPVTSNVLWGAANFVYEAMDYYGDGDVTETQRLERFRRWGQRYGRATWEPNAGTGGIDVYETDPFKCAHWRAVDHRAPTAAGA